MIALEWLSIPAGVIAGALSGFGAAYLGRPSAVTKAAIAQTETEARLARRADLVDSAHHLVSQATAENWSAEYVASDPRYLRIRAELSESIRAAYVKSPPRVMRVEPDGGWRHEALADDIDRLAKDWQLT